MSGQEVQRVHVAQHSIDWECTEVVGVAASLEGAKDLLVQHRLAHDPKWRPRDRWDLAGGLPSMRGSAETWHMEAFDLQP